MPRKDVLSISEILKLVMLLHMFVFIFKCTVSVQMQIQRFLEEPESVVVVEGSCVRLHCRVANKEGVLQWTKDDFGLGGERTMPEYERFSLFGDDRETWNLEIEHAKIADDGRYQCQVGATNTSGPIRSKYAKVTVLVRPQLPVLSTGPIMTVSDGQSAVVECVSRGGKPAGRITWYVDNKRTSENVKMRIEKMKNSKLMTTISSIVIKVTRNMSGSVIMCEAANPVENMGRKVMTMAMVKYSPVVTLYAEDEFIEEGDDVKYVCNVDAWPDATEISWHIDRERVDEASGTKEMVVKMERLMNGKRISCRARNEAGQGENTININVSCE